MVKLNFYGGVGQIGGNKIRLADKSTSVMLDFGMNFENYNKFFTEFMPMRKCNCIKDLITLGLLPDLKGVYRRDYCKHMKLKDQKRTSLDGVLITHGHLDHIGFINFLRKDIPIYVSPETRAIMKLFDISGAGGYNEYCDFKPTFQFIPKKRGDGLKRRTARDGVEERDIRVFEYDKPFELGDLIVTPYRVDHSLPGATGFVIETSKGNIVYTGDLRFHGRHAYWSKEFVDKARISEPFLMLSEGTRINTTSARTEDYVKKRSTKLINGKKGVVIANFPIRDTDRLLTFYETAVENKRKLVVETRQALLLDLLKKEGLKELPSSDDEHIRVFAPKKSWGLICKEGVPEKERLRDYQSWEKKYIQQDNMVTAEDLHKSQSKYLLFMNYFQLNNLLDILPSKDSVHIRSICEPFNEGMELDEERVNNWLKKFNLWPKHQVHASGHAPRNHLFNMVETIKPQTLIPIHTENPERYKSIHENVKIVKEDRAYEF